MIQFALSLFIVLLIPPSPQLFPFIAHLLKNEHYYEEKCLVHVLENIVCLESERAYMDVYLASNLFMSLLLVPAFCVVWASQTLTNLIISFLVAAGCVIYMQNNAFVEDNFKLAYILISSASILGLLNALNLAQKVGDVGVGLVIIISQLGPPLTLFFKQTNTLFRDLLYFPCFVVLITVLLMPFQRSSFDLKFADTSQSTYWAAFIILLFGLNNDLINLQGDFKQLAVSSLISVCLAPIYLLNYGLKTDCILLYTAFLFNALQYWFKIAYLNGCSFVLLVLFIIKFTKFKNILSVATVLCFTYLARLALVPICAINDVMPILLGLEMVTCVVVYFVARKRVFIYNREALENEARLAFDSVP